MLKLFLPVVLACLALVAGPAAAAGASTWSELHRPLNLPQIGPGTACPVSPVDDRVDWEPINIFGTYGTGRGPVYPGIGYPPVGELQMTNGPGGWFGTKVFWYVKPSYRGRVLIRGAQVDGPGRLGFSGRRRGEIRIGPGETVEWSGQPPHSRGYPSGVLAKSPGCYGAQIDGTNFSRAVVFKVTTP